MASFPILKSNGRCWGSFIRNNAKLPGRGAWMEEPHWANTAHENCGWTVPKTWHCAFSSAKYLTDYISWLYFFLFILKFLLLKYQCVLLLSTWLTLSSSKCHTGITTQVIRSISGENTNFCMFLVCLFASLFLIPRLKIVKISFKCKQFFIELRREAVSTHSQTQAHTLTDAH